MAISDCNETPEFTRAVAKVCLSWWGVTWPRPARAAALDSSSRSTSLETRRPWWVSRKSASRPVRNTRTGRLADFLLTHQGRRVSKDVLRDELSSAAARAGLGQVTPHQLRHTFATALVNSGVSLQSLMAMLGHVSAEMSLRYGRLFDTTVRAEYERALTQAKAQLGAHGGVEQPPVAKAHLGRHM